jgi:hypothetical protein
MIVIIMLWIKNDKESIPDKTGNVGRRIQISSQAALSMLMPHDADFISTKSTRYIIAIVPALQILQYVMWVIRILSNDRIVFC